ncbi:hypothetical protein OG921_22815 [Aldersonia sp. NBC_00410]|uniref:hypothetical protein n=1 Tax=Aldersonia sp. NBC_00410 TaxID=2975954 RepID=UPI00224FD540|nr:hypothetical protein [Aldersonia sp. NBC_00410]MCX5046007.1 hypothetical protein [Aldersonia sp. NBC_00410]
MTNPFLPQIPNLDDLLGGAPANVSIDILDGVVQGQAGFDADGGVEASVGVPGGPELSFGADGYASADAGIAAEGSYTHIAADDGGPVGDSLSIDTLHGGVAGYGGVDLGGGIEASLDIPGGPELGLDGQGEFGAHGGFEAQGGYTHIETHDVM